MEYKSDLNAEKANLENPCMGAEDGWRLPNQKELAIFVFHKKADTGQDFNTYFSCTKNAFADNSYCGYNGNNRGIQSMTVWSGERTIGAGDNYNNNLISAA